MPLYLLSNLRRSLLRPRVPWYTVWEPNLSHLSEIVLWSVIKLYWKTFEDKGLCTFYYI